MALIEARERHEDLLEELIAEVAAYKPDVDRELLAHAFEFATRAHDGQERRSGEAFIHHPFGAAKICAELQARRARRSRRRSCTTSSRTPSVGIDEVRAEFGDEIANLVEGVTKLTRIQFQSREHAEAENYRKMIVAMAAGRAGHPDQARRPPAQHAHDRVPRPPEAGPEGARDARGLRAARAPARHPRAQVGARGPRVRDAPSAQVRGDRGDGRRAPRRPRGARPRGRDRAHRRSSTRSTSRPRSPAARSTSTRSTTRWPRRAASSTRSTT